MLVPPLLVDALVTGVAEMGDPALFGVEIVVRLGWYVAPVLAALLIQLLVVYSSRCASSAG